MGALDPTAEGQSGLANGAWVRDLTVMLAQDAAPSAMVLFRGETGVGKEFTARLIHAASPRRDRLFIKANCASRPLSRLESELFGHEKGATPSADRRVLGRFEFASKGTLFLDEIDALARPLVPKLLHALRHGEVARIGGREPIRTDVWVLASTKQTLEGPKSDALWEALLSLKLIEIRIPPLRERKDEIPVLATRFLLRFTQQYHRHADLSADTISLFGDYAWPGNVRELEEVVRLLVVAGDPGRIHREITARIEHYRYALAHT